MTIISKAEIKENIQIAPGIYRMVFKSEYIAENARPGQFVNVKCCEGLNALLRRPISICSADPAQGTVDIVYQVRGSGTGYLSCMKKGSLVDLMGPLGEEFDLDESFGRIAVAGGGIGIFPLLFLLQRKKAELKDAFLGFRNKDAVVLLDRFEEASSRVMISTDDGSLGHNGLVTDLLAGEIKNRKYDVIYTCGPLPMMRKVAELAGDAGSRCQVSMEQRMGCGIGACLVCACKTKEKESWKYGHVCKDGPVFWSDEVILDE